MEMRRECLHVGAEVLARLSDLAGEEPGRRGASGPEIGCYFASRRKRQDAASTLCGEGGGRPTRNHASVEEGQ